MLLTLTYGEPIIYLTQLTQLDYIWIEKTMIWMHLEVESRLY